MSRAFEPRAARHMASLSRRAESPSLVVQAAAVVPIDLFVFRGGEVCLSHQTTDF